MPLLLIENLSVRYGAIHALQGISIALEKGKIVSLIGANGAGKTTALRTVSGILKPSAGSIRFRDVEIGGMPPHRIVGMGLVQCPEGRMIFSNLSVLENLKMGAYLSRDRKTVEEGIEQAFRLFPRLGERTHQMAGTLSGGEQQMLAVARALMSRPECLLLDEPSLGIAPILVRMIFDKIVEISRTLDLSILLVEQNANLALEISDYAYVLETGRITLHGPPAQLREQPAVRASYLGG
jgi:branched-chain amino acid transport system ATP-binding protein